MNRILLRSIRLLPFRPAARRGLAAALVSLCCFWWSWTPGSLLTGGEPLPGRFDALIEDISAAYTMNPLLVKALIQQESRFEPRATGRAGEIGLMQIRMCVVRDWAAALGRPAPGREEVFDPYLNLEIGIWHLSRAVANWEGNPDQLALALCEYNAGRAKLLRWVAHYDGNCPTLIRECGSASYIRRISEGFVELAIAETAARLVSNTEVLP